MKLNKIIIFLVLMFSLCYSVLSYDGTGTELDPYKIYNCNDFINMGNSTGSYFEQQNNIDFTSCNNNLTRPDFTGSRYDGLNYNITGYNTTSGKPLFSVLSNSIFYNVSLINPIATGNAPIVVTSHYGYGFFGLTTSGNTYFYNCHIINPYIYMDINNNLYVGSFIGYNTNFYSTRFYYSSVENIDFDLRVSTTSSHLLIAGGFMASRDSGTTSQYFYESFSTGKINTTRSNQPNLQYLSGFFGMVAVPFSYDLWSNVSFYSNYPYTRANGRKTTSSGTQTRIIYRGNHITAGWIFDSSDLIGAFYDGEYLNLSCENETLLGDCLDSTNRNNVSLYNNSNYDFVNTWGVRNVTGEKNGEICLLWEDDCININDYEAPILTPPYTLNGSGTEIDPYKIYNCSDFSYIINDTIGYYEVMNNIDFNDCGQISKPYTLNTFSGFIEGNNYNISNLNLVTNTDYYGWLARTINPHIQNLNFYDTSIIGSGINSGLFGGLTGSLTNNYIKNVHQYNTYLNGRFIGGFVGVVPSGKYLTITNSSQNNISTLGIDGTSVISGFTESNSDFLIIRNSKVTGKALGGGLFVGMVGGYASDSINIYDSYSRVDGAYGLTIEGYVTNSYHANSSINYPLSNLRQPVNSYFNGEIMLINCETTSLLGNCSNTETMQDFNTYINVGWNFNDTWGMTNYSSYPCLLWESDCYDYRSFEAPPIVPQTVNVTIIFPLNLNNYSSYDGLINVTFNKSNNATCYLNNNNLGFSTNEINTELYTSSYGENIVNVSCYYNATVFDEDTINFNMCIPQFYCSEYLPCENDYENCLNVTDNRSCGLNYTGLYSDFRNFCGVPPLVVIDQYDSTLKIGKCPNNTGSILIFISMLFFACFIVLLLFLFKNMIVGMFSAIILITLGVIIVSCIPILGIIIAMFGIMMIPISIVIGFGD